MIVIFKQLLFLSLLTPNYGATAQAPDFTLGIKASGKALEVTATPPVGHHINTAAPMELEDLTTKTSFKCSSAKEQKVVFKLKDAQKHALAATLYLCDNAKTFCEKHRVASNSSGQLESSVTTTGDDIPTSSKPSQASVKYDRDGFIVDDPKFALNRAAREKKPLLIDFFGIWCPPCNMFNEKVFNTREFKNATDAFVKLKLDADSQVSWELKSKYRINGYPTIIFATSEGDEIHRIVGFRPKNEFLAEVRRAWNEREESFSRLKAKADQGNALAAKKIALIHFERKEYDLALKYFEKCADLVDTKEKKALAEIGFLEEKADIPNLIEALERTVTEFSETPDSLENRAKLAKLYEQRNQPEKKKQQLEHLIETAKKLTKTPAVLVGQDLTPADLMTLVAQAQDELGHPAESRQAWKSAAEAYRKNMTSENERGNGLEFAACLWRAGETIPAEQLYRRFEAKYPQEFTFYFAHARMELALRRLPIAEKLARKAFERSYGDNRLRVAAVLAQTYLNEDKRAESLVIIREALASTPLPKDSSIRTHQYSETLRALEKKLTEPKPAAAEASRQE